VSCLRVFSSTLQSSSADFLLTQLFDQFLEGNWASESCDSKPIPATADQWSDYLWLDQYNPLSCETKDFQNLDELESNFNLSTTSSPTAFSLPSPISDSSSLAIDPFEFDQKTLWFPTAIETPTVVPCNSPSEASSPSPSSEESSSYSPRAESKRSPVAPRSRSRKPKSQPQSKTCVSKGKNSHNLIEKRYRNNLNSKIQILRDCIPSFRSSENESEEIEVKCNKGIILEKAIEYITQLERKVELLEKDNVGMQLMVKAYLPRNIGRAVRY